MRGKAMGIIVGVMRVRYEEGHLTSMGVLRHCPQKSFEI